MEEVGLGFCVTRPAKVSAIWLPLFPNFHKPVVVKRFWRVSDPQQAANRPHWRWSFDKADSPSSANGHYDYTVSHHPLQMFTYQKLASAMRKLYQATKRQGVLRGLASDILKAFASYEAHRALVILDAVEHSIDAKLRTYLTWNGANRMLSIFPHLEQLLLPTRFEKVLPVACDHTASRCPDIAALGRRQDETLFIERFK
jgi:hypothetical protein